MRRRRLVMGRQRPRRMVSDIVTTLHSETVPLVMSGGLLVRDAVGRGSKISIQNGVAG